MSAALRREIEAAMEPLAKKYGLRITGEEDEGNYTALRYANDAAGLKVAVDWSELRPFVTLYELKQGRFPDEPANQNVPGLARRAFDADDLITLRAKGSTPVGKMFPKRDHTTVRPLLSAYVQALDSYASDVLGGDFTVFPVLDEIVSRRAAEFNDAS